MTNDQYKAIAVSIFKHHSSLKEIHITADGQAFPIKQDAIANARNVESDKNKVVSIKRDDLEAPTPVVESGETIDHIVTKEDLKNNPELKEQGVKVGDVIQVPVKEE